MLFSEFAGKVIVNLENGEILGDVSEADLLVAEITGKIDAILLPTRGFMLNRNHDAAQLSIAWQDVRKIGPEIIVVEIDSSRNPLW